MKFYQKSIHLTKVKFISCPEEKLKACEHLSPSPIPKLSFYKTPLELGILLARRGSTSNAMRRDLAKALNVASIM